VQGNHNSSLLFKFSLLRQVYSLYNVCHNGSNFPFDSDMTPLKVLLNVRYKKLVSRKNLNQGSTLFIYLFFLFFAHCVQLCCSHRC
jgi:hypothetical protein